MSLIHSSLSDVIFDVFDVRKPAKKVSIFRRLLSHATRPVLAPKNVYGLASNTSKAMAKCFSVNPDDLFRAGQSAARRRRDRFADFPTIVFTNRRLTFPVPGDGRHIMICLNYGLENHFGKNSILQIHGSRSKSSKPSTVVIMHDAADNRQTDNPSLLMAPSSIRDMDAGIAGKSSLKTLLKEHSTVQFPEMIPAFGIDLKRIAISRRINVESETDECIGFDVRRSSGIRAVFFPELCMTDKPMPLAAPECVRCISGSCVITFPLSGGFVAKKTFSTVLPVQVIRSFRLSKRFSESIIHPAAVYSQVNRTCPGFSTRFFSSQKSVIFRFPDSARPENLCLESHCLLSVKTVTDLIPLRFGSFEWRCLLRESLFHQDTTRNFSRPGIGFTEIPFISNGSMHFDISRGLRIEAEISKSRLSDVRRPWPSAFAVSLSEKSLIPLRRLKFNIGFLRARQRFHLQCIQMTACIPGLSKAIKYGSLLMLRNDEPKDDFIYGNYIQAMLATFPASFTAPTDNKSKNDLPQLKKCLKHVYADMKTSKNTDRYKKAGSKFAMRRMYLKFLPLISTSAGKKTSHIFIPPLLKKCSGLSGHSAVINPILQTKRRDDENFAFDLNCRAVDTLIWPVFSFNMFTFRKLLSDISIPMRKRRVCFQDHRYFNLPGFMLLRRLSPLKSYYSFELTREAIFEKTYQLKRKMAVPRGILNTCKFKSPDLTAKTAWFWAGVEDRYSVFTYAFVLLRENVSRNLPPPIGCLNPAAIFQVSVHDDIFTVETYQDDSFSACLAAFDRFRRISHRVKPYHFGFMTFGSENEKLFFSRYSKSESAASGKLDYSFSRADTKMEIRGPSPGNIDGWVRITSSWEHSRATSIFAMPFSNLFRSASVQPTLPGDSARTEIPCVNSNEISDMAEYILTFELKNIFSYFRIDHPVLSVKHAMFVEYIDDAIAGSESGMRHADNHLPALLPGKLPYFLSDHSELLPEETKYPPLTDQTELLAVSRIFGFVERGCDFSMTVKEMMIFEKSIKNMCLSVANAFNEHDPCEMLLPKQDMNELTFSSRMSFNLSEHINLLDSREPEFQIMHHSLAMIKELKNADLFAVVDRNVGYGSCCKMKNSRLMNAIRTFFRIFESIDYKNSFIESELSFSLTMFSIPSEFCMETLKFDDSTIYVAGTDCMDSRFRFGADKRFSFSETMDKDIELPGMEILDEDIYCALVSDKRVFDIHSPVSAINSPAGLLISNEKRSCVMKAKTACNFSGKSIECVLAGQAAFRAFSFLSEPPHLSYDVERLEVFDKGFECGKYPIFEAADQYASENCRESHTLLLKHSILTDTVRENLSFRIPYWKYFFHFQGGDRTGFDLDSAFDPDEIVYEHNHPGQLHETRLQFDYSVPSRISMLPFTDSHILEWVDYTLNEAAARKNMDCLF